MGGKTGSGKDGCHGKEVPLGTQKNAQTRNFGCRLLWALVFEFWGYFGCHWGPFQGLLRLLMEGKTGGGEEGCHRKEVPPATQKNAQTSNYGCRLLWALVFGFGGCFGNQ